MPLVTNTVPNMIGGVSQTPATIRLPNQCEVQENAVSSVVDGLSKRPPTQHIDEMTEYDSDSIGATDGFMAVHAINRDTTERYIVSVGKEGVSGQGLIRAHDIDGNAIQVFNDHTDENHPYLSITDGSSDADDVFEFLTIADVTYVVNKEKFEEEPEVKQDVPDFSNNESAF